MRRLGHPLVRLGRRLQNGHRGPIAGVLLAAFAACSEPDPKFGEPGAIVERELPNEELGTGGRGTESPEGPFAGTTATAPARTMKDAHAGGKGPAPADDLDCMTCHRDGVNSGGAPSFSYGGRINENNVPVADAEILVVQGSEKLGPVKSDADGFFSSPGAAVKDKANAWVRKGTGTGTRMAGVLAAGTGGGCNSAKCHVDGQNGSTAKINL